MSFPNLNSVPILNPIPNPSLAKTPLSMPNCPRCHQSINPQAVTCPYCRTPLKAYGHPGIPLHRATGERLYAKAASIMRMILVIFLNVLMLENVRFIKILSKIS
jgi:hypothetical protein